MITLLDIKRTNSEAVFETTKTYFPGGGISPVRAFMSEEGTPLLIKKEEGFRLTSHRVTRWDLFRRHIPRPIWTLQRKCDLQGDGCGDGTQI